MSDLPADLRGPVPLVLAVAQEALPAPAALPGAVLYEMKWDGFRCAAVHRANGVRLWSRQGCDLSDHFPDVRDAVAAQVRPGTVLDGELVIWHRDRLDFALLQRRLANSPRRALTLAAEHPASYMVFDVLAVDGADVRFRPLVERRQLLERLGRRWRPPLQVSPATTDKATALEWATAYRPAGIEGVMVKAAAGRYRPGRRDWIRVKSRESSEVIIGAVTGPLTAPQTVVVGLPRDGRLAIVGRSVTLPTAQARSLAAVLRPAAPDHPWPDELTSRFGAGRDKVRLTKVEPVLVAEILADAAMEGPVYRHPVRFVRHRPDLTIADIAGPSGP